jgi:two-component sensor histidine kinase
LSDDPTKELEALRAENRILRRELHHRVRNNLQTVASLVELTARDELIGGVRAAFATLSARIAAIAAVYQIVEEPTHLAAVDIAEVIRELLTPSSGGLDLDASEPRIALDVRPVILPLDEAIPLALFVSEALQRTDMSRDHGLGPGRVSLINSSDAAGEAINLTVSAPLEADRPLPEHGRLMEGIARQVSGKVSTSREDGAAVFRLEFKTKQTPAVTPLAKAERLQPQTGSD